MKMHLLCTKDNLRPAMCHVQVKDGFINATNAHILGRVDAKALLGDALDELPSEFYIHATEWKKLVAGKPYAYAVEGTFLKGITKKGTNYAKFKTPEELNGRFPDVDNILADPNRKPEKIDSSFCFDPNLLATLCEALGFSRAIIVSMGENKPHYVSDGDLPGFGIIMPMLVNASVDAVNIINKLRKS